MHCFLALHQKNSYTFLYIHLIKLLKKEYINNLLQFVIQKQGEDIGERKLEINKKIDEFNDYVSEEKQSSFMNFNDYVW